MYENADLVAGFNIKYDLHWLRRLGFQMPKRVWCAQVAEFFLSRQTKKYPSLDETSLSYGLDPKINVVEEEYWKKGINTHEIPRQVLLDYGMRDVRITHAVVQEQMRRVQPHQKVLLNLEMHDLLTLQEIEWNGLKFDPTITEQKAREVEAEISATQAKLDLRHSVPSFNWASPAHISALLYGGEVKEVRKVPVGVYKSGAKAGQPKFQNEVVMHKLPRMYTPPRGSETAKAGVYSVDEDTLLKIKDGEQELIQGILRVKELQKRNSTYLRGLLENQTEAHTEPFDIVHGQYNQVVAQTGRLSSSNPNMQNIDGKILDMFVTRF